MDKSIMQSIAYEAMNYSWCGSDAELLPASELMTTNYRILLQTFPDCYGKSRQEVSELFTKKKDFMNFITKSVSVKFQNTTCESTAERQSSKR